MFLAYFVAFLLRFSYGLNLPRILNQNLLCQPSWRIKERVKDVSVIEVLSVLSRFEKREDFYEGKGYIRPEKGLLTRENFYERIKGLKVRRIPKSVDGGYFGIQDNELNAFKAHLQASIPTQVSIL
jgi:hypothetical protein